MDPIMLNLDSDPWLIGYGVNWLNFAQTVLKSVGGKTFLSIFKNTTKIMALEEIFYQLGLWMVNFIFNLTPFASYLSYFHLCISNLDPDSQQWGGRRSGHNTAFYMKTDRQVEILPGLPAMVQASWKPSSFMWEVTCTRNIMVIIKISRHFCILVSISLWKGNIIFLKIGAH